MKYALFNAFTKVTAWPVQFVCFRTHIAYENRGIQGRHIHGPALVICNHTSVFDYAVLLFVFWTRTIRCQMAELLFKKPGVGTLIRLLGGIYVDRNSHNFRFLEVSEEILRKGGTVLVFPESRIPLPGEATPLEFKPSAAYLALAAGVPVIPVYTDGSYFNLKKRAHVVVGCPIDAASLTDPALSEKENIARVSEKFREKITELGKICHE